jgi:hypothetical protein
MGRSVFREKEDHMAQSFTTQGLQDVFSYPFQDPHWKEKFLIGSLFAFLSIILSPTIILAFVPAIFLYGYFARVLRTVIVERVEPSLPEWDDWNDLFRDGAKLLAVGLIYSLPIIVLFVLAYGSMFLMVLAGDLVEEAGGGGAPLVALVPMAGLFGFMGLFALGMLASILVGSLLPAILGHVIAKDQFGAAFRFGEWWAVLRANLGGFLIVYILAIGLQIVTGFALNILYMTIVLCCLIPFALAPISVYLMVVTGALFGEAYRSGAERLPSPPEAPQAPEGNGSEPKETIAQAEGNGLANEE